MIPITLAMTLWLALGIPLWFFTLKVDRATLDYSVLEQYDTLSTQPLSAAIRIAVYSEMIPDLAEATEFYLNNLKNSPATKFIVDSKCTPQNELCIEAKLGSIDTVVLNTLENMQITFSHETLTSGNVPEVVAKLLYDHMYRSFGDNNEKSVMLNYAPSLHLTFSLFSESGQVLKWDAKNAIDRHLGALLNQINTEVVDITIDTQTSLFTKPLIDLTERKLKLEDLNNFVDFAEWPLSSLTKEQTLHFVLFVPESNIDVLDSETNSFIIPQWGGVVISEVIENNDFLSSHELEPAMQLFAKQLLALLGMNSGPRLELCLNDLARRNSLRGVKAAAASIGSLKRLAASMPTIPIPQRVSQRVNEAIDNINGALKALDVADLKTAALKTRLAYIAAEAAFFNKDMVAQAYFPDEHKLAVYMPLMGPLCVVVLSGWFRIIKSRRGKKKKN